MLLDEVEESTDSDSDSDSDSMPDPDDPEAAPDETKTAKDKETQTDPCAVSDVMEYLENLVTEAYFDAPPELVVDAFHRLTRATEKLRPKYESAMESRDELIDQFLKENEEYRCPISLQLMEDPVITMPKFSQDIHSWTGQTYDRASIEMHISQMPDAPVDPLTKKRIHPEVFGNGRLRGCIERDLKRSKLDVFFKSQ